MQTELRNADLGQLVELLKRQQGAKLDAVVPGYAISSENGVLCIEGMGADGPAGGPGWFLPTRIMDGQIAEKLGIPLNYLRRLREQRLDIYDDNLNGWLHGGLFPRYPRSDEDAERREMVAPAPDTHKYLARTFIDDSPGGVGIGRALLSDRFRLGLDNLDVTMAILDGVRQSGAEIELVGANLSETRMTLNIAAPGVRALAPKLLSGYRNPLAGTNVPERWRARGVESSDEPVVFAGFQATNGETGGSAFTITPRLLVVRCWNGQVIPHHSLRRVHLGGQLEEGVVQWSKTTTERALALVTSQATDAVKAFLDEDYVEMVLEQMEEKATRPLDDPAKAVQLVAIELHWTEEQQAGILDHFIKGGQLTAGGVMQACSSYAQVVNDPDVAFDLEWQAFQAMELAASS